MRQRFAFFKELWLFFSKEKRWFLAPLVILLVLFGLMLIFAQGSVFAPLLYTLF